MEKAAGICARENEINKIDRFISKRVESKQSGILYLTGPPGTGKTMSVNHVLSRYDNIPKIMINCLRARKAKHILERIYSALDTAKLSRSTETDMIEKLGKLFGKRSTRACLLVLDELDQIPKTRSADLIRTVFTWPNQPHSRLILIGIANSVNLTSRFQVINSLVRGEENLKRILFKPYSSNDIKSILQWYLENDENFENELVDSKAIEMISKKYAREDGDIRSALNALASSIDDTRVQSNKIAFTQECKFPTPPSTPPPSPCREKTNVASVANSCKKRLKRTNYKDDTIPFAHQILLVCIMNLCHKSANKAVNSRSCRDFAQKAFMHYDIKVPDVEYLAMLETLEMQGVIFVRRWRHVVNIVLKASNAELDPLITQKDKLLEAISIL